MKGTSGTAALYYHRNQQYSIVGLSDAAGTLVERYAYTAYGELTILAPNRTARTTSSFENRYTYTGREWDPTLRLYYFRARWLEPKAGRFIGRDPLGYVVGMGLYGAYFAVRGTAALGLLRRVDFTELRHPEPCGNEGAGVGFKFAVDNFDGEGWIVQKVELYCDTQDCPYKNKGRPDPLNPVYDGCHCDKCPTESPKEPTLVFYEAFPFWRKYQEPVKGADWISKQSKYVDDWNTGKNLWRNSRTRRERCGALRLRATAKFYSLNQLLQIENITDWGFKYYRKMSVPEKCFGEDDIVWANPDESGMPIFTEREPQMWLWPSTGEATRAGALNLWE